MTNPLLATEHKQRGFSSMRSTTRLLLDRVHFRRICELIHQHAGIVLSDHKQEMVYNRLARRLHWFNLKDFGDYLALLENNPGSEEWQIFINLLTTNLTSFFREAHHFSLLADHARSRPHGYSVWSAAVSSGEEAYSIAMTLAEVLGMTSIAPQVWGSDINTQVLEKARAGIYRREEAKSLTKQQLARFFLRGKGAYEGLIRVRPELKQRVTFQIVNLLSPRWNIHGPFDAIFCRNVLIYFDNQTQLRILRRFIMLLKPGGLLFTGHSENCIPTSSGFYLRGQTVYGMIKDR